MPNQVSKLPCQKNSNFKVDYFAFQFCAKYSCNYERITCQTSFQILNYTLIFNQ